MTAIKPIIKKNLIYSKRHFCRTILQLFYPCILLWIIALIINTNDEIPIQEMTYYDYSKVIDKYENYNFQLISSKTIQSSYAVIGNDDTYSDKLIETLSPGKLNICSSECKVFSFKSRNEFNKFIKRPEYTSENFTIGYVIEYNEKLEFLLSSENIQYKSEWFNLNEFNIVPDLYKLVLTQSISVQNEFSVLLIKFLFAQKDINPNSKELLLTSTPMKSPSLISSKDINILISVIPAFLSISYISILFQFVLWLVTEKEKKLKDLLIRQGVTSTQYLLSWLYTFVILTIIPIIINTILLKHYFFQNTNFLFIFLNLFLFSLNILGMALVFHQFVNDVRSGQSLLKLLYIGVSLFSVVIGREGVHYIFRYIFSIFPQTVLKSSFEIFLSTKNFENGLDWTLMSAYYNGVNMYILYTIYVLDFVLYILLAYFLQNYSQSGLGISEYLFSSCLNDGRKIHQSQELTNNETNKNFNNSSRSQTSNDKSKNIFIINKINKSKFNLLDDNLLNNEELIHMNANTSYEKKKVISKKFEAVTNEDLLDQIRKKENLRIENVSKYYDQFLAVDNFSCDLFKDQIFVLLGHNGAGKTTLIKIISGLEECNNGDIFHLNHSLITDKEYLYRNLGLCSQEDIFFEELTVKENLEIMTEIKGAQRDSEEINELLTKIDLISKKDELAKNLSGGQKRKLCIAIALIGNSKIILLDEPTSGMDVTAKRGLWEFLKNYKDNKIIIITTHSLDEAEYLADRIGIMSEGQLICVGTSSYLKNQFSCGFNVNLLIDPKLSDADRKFLISELRYSDSNSTVKVMSKETIVMNFPNISDDCDNIFNTIEEIKQRFGIINYTISTTSLEDVFLQINCDDVSKNMFETSQFDLEKHIDRDSLVSVNDEKDSSDKTNNQNRSNEFEDSFTTKTAGFCTEFKLNLVRHTISLWRNKKSFVIELLACSVTFFVYLFFFKSFINDEFAFCSLNNLLAKGKIYYGIDKNLQDKIDIKYFENYFYQDETNNLIQLDGIENASIENIQDFDQFVFDRFYYHNIKAAFYVKKNSEERLEVFNLYSSSSIDYNMAMNNLILSSFLKNEYGIHTKLFVT